MPSTVDVGDFRADGFVIEGANELDDAAAIAGAGDVNGDGLADIIVGAQGADNNNRATSGTAYIVFGKTTTEPVDLADFNAGTQGDAGYRIDGPWGFSLAGQSVAGLGDVNGDGLDDVIVGAPFAGNSYVVFGKTDSMPIDLLVFDWMVQGTNPFGYRIDTPTPSYSDLYSVGGAGDVNGDGIPDAIVGVIPTIRSTTGSAWVVFGSSDTSVVNVRNLGDRGFRIKGLYKGSTSGYAVAGAGDVNGDGKDDVVVGVPGQGRCRDLRSSAFVVFGKETPRTVKLGNLGNQGYEITARAKGQYVCIGLGISLALAGDVNRDGRPDLLVGSMGRGAYVIFGKPGTRRVNVKRLGRRGYHIPPSKGQGQGVAAAGDVTGDKVPDLLVVSTYAGPEERRGIRVGIVSLVRGRAI